MDDPTGDVSTPSPTPTARVLVTGASGLVGTWLRRTAPVDLEVVALVHRTPVDGQPTVAASLLDPSAVARAVEQVRPTLIVHAAVALDEPSIVDATGHIADAAADAGAGLIHISTDAVFAGDGRPVDEADAPDPVSDYGRWKAAAEAVVAASSPTAAFVRLPLVVSLAPADQAVARVRAGALEGEGTRWFDDELRQPAMAADLAAAIWRIALRPAAQRAGAWHLPGPETLSRFEIAQRIAEVLGLDPAGVAPEPTPPGLARPRHLHLGDARARTEIAWAPTPIFT